MADLESKRLIVAKGFLFIIVAALSAIGIVCYSPRIRVIILTLVLMWASARSYYFVFYVLEKYVDPNLKYTGIIDLIKNIMKRTRDN